MEGLPFAPLVAPLLYPRFHEGGPPFFPVDGLLLLLLPSPCGVRPFSCWWSLVLLFRRPPLLQKNQFPIQSVGVEFNSPNCNFRTWKFLSNTRTKNGNSAIRSRTSPKSKHQEPPVSTPPMKCWMLFNVWFCFSNRSFRNDKIHAENTIIKDASENNLEIPIASTVFFTINFLKIIGSGGNCHLLSPQNMEPRLSSWTSTPVQSPRAKSEFF